MKSAWWLSMPGGCRSAAVPSTHRTMGDRDREIVAAGFVLLDVIEPEWPDDFAGTWGQWSPERGEMFPGTAIFVSRQDR